jgi:hypothetical protein
MRRILLMMSMALVFAAALALSGAAQAKPVADSADAQCLKLAIRTLGTGFKPSGYTFVGGTEGNDDFTPEEATGGPDVFCGFGDDDSVLTLDAGDIFLGGEGDDAVGANNGTYYGGAGDDIVYTNEGTFYGGAGNDRMLGPGLGTFVQ